VAYILPTVPDFKTQFVRDFPYAVPVAGGGSGAVLTPTIGSNPNGGILSIAITAGGSGYPGTPTVIAQSGNGIGSFITASLTAGVVTGVTIVREGYGYTQVPTIYVSNGRGDNTDTSKVTDFDIASSQNKAASFNMTQALWSSQAGFTIAYGLLSAHYLCEDLLAGGMGMNGKAEWLTQSKTVGNVTESYSIPDRILKSPYLSKLSKTTYGAQFLELISPQLIGNFASFHRDTLP
jgi:hypothetical protein